MAVAARAVVFGAGVLAGLGLAIALGAGRTGARAAGPGAEPGPGIVTTHTAEGNVLYVWDLRNAEKPVVRIHNASGGWPEAPAWREIALPRAAGEEGAPPK